ncbi:hypothetical protein IPN41_03755 [Candidatus Falkowbacteria bacterium]|nr:MAG: hypothetical protein IPN41_03755 [Candidatus Falkowbacteria bacterium]
MKRFKKVSLLIIDLCLLGILIWQVSILVSENVISTHRLNVSGFSGRIIPEDQIKPGTFTIEVPMSEALHFGKNAILSYGDNGVQIWKPDSTTTGVFHYSSVAPQTHTSYFKVYLLKDEIILDEYDEELRVIAIWLSILMLLFMFLVTVSLLEEIKKNRNSKLFKSFKRAG